jgi:hypothetical protein
MRSNDQKSLGSYRRWGALTNETSNDVLCATASRTQTKSHSGPSSVQGARRIPALVQVHPSLSCISLRAIRGAVGRRWFRERGVVDAEISSQQIEFEHVGGVLHIRDLDSRNGTWCDGERLEPLESIGLVDGMLLRIGNTLMVYREDFTGSVLPSERLGELIAPYGMRSVARRIEAVVQQSPCCVTVTGPSGSGKELIARYLAKRLRGDEPFVAANVAALPDGVFESQLFGHVAGAYSDARHDAPGLLVRHEGGCVVLDEIGELGLPNQAKLLRLLDSQEILPVGGDRTRKVDVLLVACTNRDLEEEVENGTFREDLWARLSIHRIELTPISARSEDILAVAQALSEEAGLGLWQGAIEVEALENILLSSWPRNVRQLEGGLRDIACIQQSPGLRAWSVAEALNSVAQIRRPLLTRARVRKAMQACSDSRSAAAVHLGVSRGRLLRYLSRQQAEEA